MRVVFFQLGVRPDPQAVERALTGAEALIVGEPPTRVEELALATAKRWDLIVVRVWNAHQVAAAWRADGFDVVCHEG